ncbi:hypothetical protein [Planctomyces sp. SH-PL14]|uniref:hypothetical protein n=1 Tax=Planctomyces sp. SH-PL14 TaxID=1632864 RepID=UPI00078CCB37|nr:hypothetical protein [Planctomyces sp. SH-PL14]AMV16602.1 hypothetical protein VT03_01850 [Planctomyces sp. SH-PL14]
MLRSASTVEALERATKGDFQSGLVRALERIREESDLVTGKVTAVDQAVARMASKGASPEMLKQYRDEAEALAKTKEDQANQAANEAAKEKQRVADVARLKIEQEKLVESQKAAQYRRDEQNVARQMALYVQAQEVKESLLTKEERVQREIVRLQDLKNRGLLTEQQLQAAIRIAQSAGTAQAKGGGGGVPRGLVVQQGVIGIQDAMTGYQVNGWGGALMAGGNNAIQMFSMINPMLGSAAAVGVMAGQIAVMMSKGAGEAEKLKAQVEGIERASKLWGQGGDEFQKGLEAERMRLSMSRDRLDTAKQIVAFEKEQLVHLEAAAQRNAADLRKQGIPDIHAADKAKITAKEQEIKALEERQKKIQDEVTEGENAVKFADSSDMPGKFSEREKEELRQMGARIQRETREANWAAAERGMTSAEVAAEEKKEARLKKANEIAALGRQAQKKREAEEGAWLKARQDAADQFRRATDPQAGVRSQMETLAQVQNSSAALAADELTRTLRLIAGGTTPSGSALVGGVSYGSVEEVSSRNRAAEQQERQRMVDTIVEELRKMLTELRNTAKAAQALEQNLKLEVIN